MNQVEKITVDDAERILRREYRQDVIGVVSAYADALGTDITDAESADTWIHETIDGHGRVIYTSLAQQGLLYSDNDGAYADDFGDEGISTDGCINWSVLMFCAFRADVLEELERYQLPFYDFDDIDIEVSDAEDRHDSIREYLDQLADVRDDFGFSDVTVSTPGFQLNPDDFADFDEDANRKNVLESIGARVNEELKSNGWFD